MAPRTLIVAMLAALLVVAAPASAGYWASLAGGYAYAEVEPGERGASGEVKSNKTGAFEVDYAGECDPAAGTCAAYATERRFGLTSTTYAECALQVENMPGRCDVRSGPYLLFSGNATGDGRTGQGCMRATVLLSLREFCGEGSVAPSDHGACAGGRFGGDFVSQRSDSVCILAPSMGPDGVDGACAAWQLGRVGSCAGLVTTGFCSTVVLRSGAGETRQEIYCVGGLP